MPAERWHSGINEFLQSIGETDDELLNMLMSSVFSHSHKNDDASSAPEGDGKSEGQKFPDVLPILPLRGVVVYPNTAVPLTVGQARSIKLVDDVVGGDKLVGLVAALDPEKETPG
ncbi:partial Lon protease 2, partial [Anaerolineales bacterium]